MMGCKVGPIVWVRRRNGTWWPGKILGPDEFPDSIHHMASRRGTPIKLLGSESASVDWYNLETSKRVKAFRCGDFDECIEKAKSLGSRTPTKKIEKYARRKDAIIHALELEKQMSDNKSGKLGTYRVSKSKCGSSAACVSGTYRATRSKCGNSAVSVSRKVLTGVTSRSRSKCVYLPAKSIDYLHHKKNSPIQMKISHCQARVGNCGSPPIYSIRGKFSESTGDDESDSSKTQSLDSKAEEMTILTDSSVRLLAKQGSLEKSVAHGEHESMNNDELYELAVAGDTSALHVDGFVSGGKAGDEFDGFATSDGSRIDFHGAVSVGGGMSKWPLKGKRNIRGLSRRYENLDELGWPDQPAFKGYEEKTQVHSDSVLVGGRMKSMLIDVDLKVASYGKGHVPIVYLMSRLNGEAIIGHPIQIEVLEDGSSETLLSRNDDFGNEAFDNGTSKALRSVWKTARRTSNRAPHSHPSPTSVGDKQQLPFHSRKGLQLRKLNTGSGYHKGSKARNIPCIPQPSRDKKLVRRPPKRVCLSPGQKRSLSSIAVEHKMVSYSKPKSSDQYVDRLFKPELGATTAACIPVKLVFNRLFEGVAMPPSRADHYGDL